MTRSVPPPLPPIASGPGSSRGRGWVILATMMLPAVLIVWTVPGFVTQDGPSHLYNAHILNESLGGESPFATIFQARWLPLPNWSGHALAMALLAILSPRHADCAATTIPLLGLAASTFWLRRRVAGEEGETTAAILCALIAMNVAWLFGFTSFLLGACLFPITLGVWWNGRTHLSTSRIAILATLMVAGYFGHLVSLGLTAGALVVLAITTPGLTASRLARTAIAMSPLLVLGAIYRGLMRSGGPISPVWGHLRSLASMASWREQLGWVDPITLGRRVRFPGLAYETRWFGLVSPATLLAVALVVLAVASFRRGRSERRGWAILAAVLILGGIVSPDTLGASHGNYLPQRVVLMGLVAIVPWLMLDRVPRLAALLLVMALGIQTWTIGAYALECARDVSPMVRGIPRIGMNRRVGTLLIQPRGEFRANPRLHVDGLAGVGTGNVVWANYETAHYYFPVQFREDLRRPPAVEFEEIAKMDQPVDASARTLRWLQLLADHHREIDVLWIKGQDPALDLVNARWFEPTPIYEAGGWRLLRHR